MDTNYDLKKTYWFYVESDKTKKMFVFQDTLMNVLIAVANTNYETDGWSDYAKECDAFFDNEQVHIYEEQYLDNHDPLYYVRVDEGDPIYEAPDMDEVMDPLSDGEVADEIAYELTHNKVSPYFENIFQWEDVVPAWGDTKEKARAMMEEIWNDVDDETIVEKNPIKNQRIDENKNMTKITKQELNQMIKEEVRKQTSRNRRRLYESNEEDFEIKGTTLVRYNGNDSDVTIPDGITMIGDYAFEDCIGLKSITLPSSITSISNGAFTDCKSLKSIKIPNSITIIDDDAFRGCTNLKSIIIPNSVISIANGAFTDCKSLKSIKIPNSIKTIGLRAFLACKSLTSIKIPNNVTKIGEWAFVGCDNLTDIQIPERFKDDDTLDDIGFNDKQIDIILNKK